VQGVEVSQGDRSEGGDGVAPQEPRVAGVGPCPDPSPDLAQPGLQVVPGGGRGELRERPWGADLEHGPRMVALDRTGDQRPGGSFSQVRGPFRSPALEGTGLFATGERPWPSRAVPVGPKEGLGMDDNSTPTLQELIESGRLPV